MAWEGLIVKLAIVAAVAGLFVFLVKAYGRGERREGASDAGKAIDEAQDEGESRFDAAMQRPLNDDVCGILARYAGRLRRAGLLPKKAADDPRTPTPPE